MKKKTIKKLIFAGLLAVSVVLAGCYAKEHFAGSSLPSSASLEKFTASVRKVDGQAESHYKMALYFQKNRRNKLAIEELKRALESNPGMAKAYNAMGVSYDNLRQYDDAIRCYYAALKIDPKLDYAHNNLGYSQLLNGDNEKAIKAFRHAIRLNGKNKRYRNNLALAYVMNDQYDLAAEQFKIVDDQADSEHKLARLMYDLGKAKAHQYLKTLSGAKDQEHPGTVVVENKPAEPDVIKKKIELPIEQSQTGTPVPAAEATTVEKSVDIESTETSPSEAQPFPEETPEDSETVMTAAVEPADDDAGQNIHTTKWVSWQEESETVPAEDSSVAQPADLPTNPLHVSAVQIAAGKVAEPAAATSEKPSMTGNRPLDNQIPTERKAAPRPKIIEVSQAKEYTPLPKQLYSVEPVTAVVHVSAADTESSVRVVDPAHVTAATGESSRSVQRVIEVAAAEPQRNPAVEAPPKTKLPTEAFEVELEIANGNGIKGMAHKVGKYLELRGFKVVEIKNAHSFDHLTTKVLYSSEGKRDLDRLLQELTVIKEASNLIELEHLEKRIRVVVGKDLIALEDRLPTKRSK